jgi:hypothetical protein
MRTTLTLDPDVSAAIERLRQGGYSLRDAVNEGLRIGLSVLERPPGDAAPYRTEPVSLGGALVGSLDDIAEVLAVSEGDAFR